MAEEAGRPTRDQLEGAVGDGDEFVSPSRGQKVAIWVVGGYLALNAAAGLASLFLLAGRAIPFGADKLAMINAMPPLVFFAAFASAFATLAGGVFLLMRKRVALPFLAGAAIVKVASEAFTAPPVGATVSPRLYAAAIVGEVVVLAAILAFVVSLWRRRVLEP